MAATVEATLAISCELQCPVTDLLNQWRISASVWAGQHPLLVDRHGGVI